MPEYYLYLVRTTWPDLLVLFFMLFIILFKTVEVSLKAWSSGRGWRALLPWFVKFLGWSGILGIYLLMFLSANPDWMARPAITSGNIAEVKPAAQGKVLIKLTQKNEESEKAATEGTKKAEKEDLGEGSRAAAGGSSGETAEYLVLYADSEFGSQVRAGDKVELTYLPHKKEIVKCISL